MNYLIKYSLVTVLILLLIFIPESLVIRDHPSLCLFKTMTGAECPLCGMTRAGYELFRLNPLASLNYNPMFIILPILLTLEIVVDFSKLLYFNRFRKGAWILFGFGLTILFIYRLILHF